MIEGAVNSNYEAVVTLPLRGPEGQAREVDAVIDTGYNGFLILPPVLVEELGLTLQSEGWATLANGTVETFDVYDATALWDGKPRRVYAHMSDATPLVGMRMLDRHNLNIDVEDGGRVVIQAKE